MESGLQCAGDIADPTLLTVKRVVTHAQAPDDEIDTLIYFVEVAKSLPWSGRFAMAVPRVGDVFALGVQDGALLVLDSGGKPL
jgi:hypothetical protein